MMFLKALLVLFLSTGLLLGQDEPPNLQEIQSHSDFKILLPGHDLVANGWKVEVKWPYHVDLHKSIQKVRLHYFDRNGDFLLGIEQHKARGYILTRQITTIDVKNKTTKTKMVSELFKQGTRGEVIQINGDKAYFQAWADRKPVPGGILHWIQDNTYVEMDSTELTKEQMVELAKSMR